MMNFQHEKGEGRGNLIFGLVVLFVALYIGWKVIPVMIHVYAFEDSVREECKFLRNRSLDQLEEDIVRAAEVEKIELEEEQIESKRVRIDTYEVLRVNIDYTVPIVTPIKVFEWGRKVNYEAPIFD
jgi:transcription initiation factor IIF auxiliary subunit